MEAEKNPAGAEAFFDKDATAGPSDEQLGRLSAIAAVMMGQEDVVEELSAKLRDAQAALRKTSGETIPELMAEVGMEEFKLDTGQKVKVGTKITASIKVERRPEAHAWLRENGHGSIIKNVVAASFGVGEEDRAEALLAELEAGGHVVERKEGVHAQTLGAFVREQIRENANIPYDLLGVFEANFTKITRPKGERKV